MSPRPTPTRPCPNNPHERLPTGRTTPPPSSRPEMAPRTHPPGNAGHSHSRPELLDGLPRPALLRLEHAVRRQDRHRDVRRRVGEVVVQDLPGLRGPLPVAVIQPALGSVRPRRIVAPTSPFAGGTARTSYSPSPNHRSYRPDDAAFTAHDHFGHSFGTPADNTAPRSPSIWPLSTSHCGRDAPPTALTGSDSQMSVTRSDGFSYRLSSTAQPFLAASRSRSPSGVRGNVSSVSVTTGSGTISGASGVTDGDGFASTSPPPEHPPASITTATATTEDPTHAHVS